MMLRAPSPASHQTSSSLFPRAQSRSSCSISGHRHPPASRPPFSPSLSGPPLSSQRLPKPLQASSSSSTTSTSSRASTSTGTASSRANPISPQQQQQQAQERARQLAELIADIVQTAVQSGPRGALRFFQGAQALSTVGGEWLQKQLQVVQQQQAAGSAQPLSAVQLPGPVELRKLFEALGATYIKLGQFIASAPSLFPEEYVTEFQKCLDRTPPIPFPVIKRILRDELRRPVEEVYEWIDPEPLASASIAQVHAARLRGSGLEVVLKVVKPEVEATLNTDLSFLVLAARVLEFLNPSLARTSLAGILSDIKSSMMEEVDLQQEAVNIAAFAAYLDSSPALTAVATVPRVYAFASSRRLLTMDRLRGVPLTDLNALRSIVPNPEATLIAALNVWFGSLFACESFHADVHAGNLLVLRDGRVAFIDFGIVGRISPATWAAVSAFLTSLGSGDYTTMAAALVTMGAADSQVDLPAFARDLQRLFNAAESLDPQVVVTTTQRLSPYDLADSLDGDTTVAASLSVDEQRVNALLLELIRVSEGYGLRFPREFGLLIKQLLYFDRYTRLLAPSLNVLDDSRVRIQPPAPDFPGRSSRGRGGASWSR